MGSGRRKTIVQKFGGTSVATVESREIVTQHVIQAWEAGYQPVVVVSAMGRQGDPYATDTLKRLVEEAGGPPDERELDLLLSCGEVISAVVLAQHLKAKGFAAVALTGSQAGIITNDRFGNAGVVTVKPDRVRRELAEGKIVLVTGFQGATPDGDITTLGRGGSDTTAAILGVALNAEVIEIYTDVDGIKTADPRIVPDAVTLERITYSEAMELAHLGAQVVHPHAVEVSMAGKVPLKIRGTGSASPGTLISSSALDSPEMLLRIGRPVTGIAHVANRVYVQLREKDARNHGYLAVFDALGEAGVSVDMVHLSKQHATFIVGGNQAAETEAILSQLEVESSIQSGFAKVSAVGAGMHGLPGVVARVLRALSKADITIHETADSHANISVLVKQDDMITAVTALHQEFALQHQQTVTCKEGSLEE